MQKLKSSIEGPDFSKYLLVNSIFLNKQDIFMKFEFYVRFYAYEDNMVENNQKVHF